MYRQSPQGLTGLLSYSIAILDSIARFSDSCRCNDQGRYFENIRVLTKTCLACPGLPISGNFVRYAKHVFLGKEWQTDV